MLQCSDNVQCCATSFQRMYTVSIVYNNVTTKYLHVHTCRYMYTIVTSMYNGVQHELTMLQRCCATILQHRYNNVTSIVQWFTMMYDDVMFKLEQCYNDTW